MRCQYPCLDSNQYINMLNLIDNLSQYITAIILYFKYQTFLFFSVSNFLLFYSVVIKRGAMLHQENYKSYNNGVKTYKLYISFIT